MDTSTLMDLLLIMAMATFFIIMFMILHYIDNGYITGYFSYECKRCKMQIESETRQICPKCRCMMTRVDLD